MRTRYYRYTVQGEHSAADAQSVLGDAGSQGLIVRVDTIGGETHIYLASESGSGVMKAASPRGVKVKEVSARDVVRIR